MLNLDDLSLLVSFYKSGTLTKVAEEYHISQPTLTRTMKRIEESFGVPLFYRTANRIELNEVGIRAAHLAEELLSSSERMVADIQEFDRSLHTTVVHSCAPAPLWSLLPELSRKESERTISSKLVDDVAQLEQDFLNGKCQIAILPYPLEGSGFSCTKYLEENLSICVQKNHALAGAESVSTAEINGYNCLLSSEIGFWNNICQQTMPSSRFLIQTDAFAFRELIEQSSLPFFVTNLAGADLVNLPDRVVIPISDECMKVTFYLCRWK